MVECKIEWIDELLRNIVRQIGPIPTRPHPQIPIVRGEQLPIQDALHPWRRDNRQTRMVRECERDLIPMRLRLNLDPCHNEAARLSEQFVQLLFGNQVSPRRWIISRMKRDADLGNLEGP